MSVSGCLPVCMCTTFMPDSYRGQKRASNVLELELQMIMSYNVSYGSKTQFSSKAANIPNH